MACLSYLKYIIKNIISIIEYYYFRICIVDFEYIYIKFWCFLIEEYFNKIMEKYKR